MIDKLGLDGLGGASVRVEPAVVGLEPVAEYDDHDAELYWRKDFNIPKGITKLYSAPDVARLQAQLAAMTQERDKCIKECNEFWGKRSDQDFELICALQASEQQLREALKAIQQGFAVTHQVNAVVVHALALPQDDTALREQNAKLLEEMADKGWPAWDADDLRLKATELREGKK